MSKRPLLGGQSERPTRTCVRIAIADYSSHNTASQSLRTPAAIEVINYFTNCAQFTDRRPFCAAVRCIVAALERLRSVRDHSGGPCKCAIAFGKRLTATFSWSERRATVIDAEQSLQIYRSDCGEPVSSLYRLAAANERPDSSMNRPGA